MNSLSLYFSLWSNPLQTLCYKWETHGKRHQAPNPDTHGQIKQNSFFNLPRNPPCSSWSSLWIPWGFSSCRRAHRSTQSRSAHASPPSHKPNITASELCCQVEACRSQIRSSKGLRNWRWWWIFLCVWLLRLWRKELIRSLSLWPRFFFSLWVLICFKFMGLVFHVGLMIFWVGGFGVWWFFWVRGFGGLIIFLGWRFYDFFGLVFSCGFNDFFMLEVSVEDRDFVWICACLFAKKIQEKRI